MAQLASASGLGPEGPVFESQYPDLIKKPADFSAGFFVFLLKARWNLPISVSKRLLCAERALGAHRRRIDKAASSAPESESGVIQQRNWLCGSRPPEGTTLRVYPPQPYGRVPSAHSRGRLALQKPTPQSSVALAAIFSKLPLS